MEKPLPNFPLLFDKIGLFLIEFKKLQEAREKPPAEFIAAFDNLVKPSSPSKADEALAAFDQIVETVYAASARSCPTGSTKMRG